MIPELELLLRLVVAFLLASLLGWERERAGKAAGLRTHVIVGVGACLFVVTGIAAASGYFPGDSTTIRIEPFALIQAVAIGIGFLGGGVVFVPRDESRVQGLTTAGSIWATAAVGVTVGFGNFILGGGATVLLLIALRALARFDRSSHGE